MVVGVVGADLLDQSVLETQEQGPGGEALKSQTPISEEVARSGWELLGVRN